MRSARLSATREDAQSYISEYDAVIIDETDFRSRNVTLPLAEGPVVLAPDHQSMANVWQALENSASPALLFDWESAVVIHANPGMQRILELTRMEVEQRTGRQLMPDSCGVLVDVVSAMLHESAQYHGPIALRRGEHGVFAPWVDMMVLDHGGTRFGVDVYRAQSTAPTVEAGGPPHVLIVDDDPIVLRGMQRILTHWYAVSTATSAAEAIRLTCQDPSIACVLTDVDMPRTDGVAVRDICELLRPELRGRVVFHTATAPGSRVDPRRDAAVFKPASIDDVRSAIEQALNVRRDA